jgi:hypothetical protein
VRSSSALLVSELAFAFDVSSRFTLLIVILMSSSANGPKIGITRN